MRVLAPPSLLDAYALPGDKMRYAMSGHQFRTTPPHPETGIKMAARYGYHGIEPFQDDMPQYLKQPPEAVQEGCSTHAGHRAVHRSAAAAEYLDACDSCRRRLRATPPARVTSPTSAASI